jgi:PKD repeat protein
VILRKTISLKKRKNFKRTLFAFTFILSLAIFIIISLFSGATRAQTQYETAGTIGNADTIYHWIYNVQMNDVVVVSVNPVEFSYNSYKSVVFYPNLTQVGSSQLDYTQYTYGTHSHQFVADAPGNYLLKFWTEGNGFNYTVKSSHQVSTGKPLQATPYSVAGQINVASTNWYTIQNVNAKDPVLISVNPSELIYENYNSVVFYPNLTQVGSVGLDYTKLDYGAHSYQFVADAPGNYLLKFWTGNFAFNYTVRSSHQLSVGTVSQITPVTITPTPSVPTPKPSTTLVTSAIFSFSPNIPSTNQSVVFDASNSHSDAGNIVSYVWDFGDGTTKTTSDNTIIHMYAKPGNFTAKLTVHDTSGGQSSYTYSVIVSDLQGRNAMSVPVAIGAGVAATSATVAIGLAATKVTATAGSAAAQSASSISDLPQSQFQRFLNFLVGKEREDRKKKAQGKTNFLSSKKGELAAIAFSVSLMTIIFSFVEANGLPRFLDVKVLEVVVPSTFLSSIIVKMAMIVTDTFSAKSCGVEKQYSLWPIGTITFILTGLLVMFPFASPGITKNSTQDLSPGKNAMLTISKTMLVLALAVPFAVLGFFGFSVIADAGLLAVLSATFFSLVPIEPLPGKAIASYKKWVAILGLLLIGSLLYGFILKLLPPIAYLIAGAFAAVIGSWALYRTRKSPTDKTIVAFPPPPPPPPPPPT